MSPTQDAKHRCNNADDHQRTGRINQMDRFDLLLAASEVDDVCPFWAADYLAAHLPIRQQVSP